MLLEFFQSKENNRPSHYVMTKEKGFLARWRYRYEVTFGLYVRLEIRPETSKRLSHTDDLAGTVQLSRDY